MTSTVYLKDIAASLPVFLETEQKEKILFVIGALMTRLISLKKAAEIMGIDSDELLHTLDLLGIEFSYLSSEDAELERKW